jgi:hypothetical protein
VWLKQREFERLYAPGAGGAPPAGLPVRPDPSDTWFHSGDLNDPAGQTGHRIGS